ncbi:MAG TPA: ATP-binding protein [Pyrinomonadaceae bacterium]|nr:ATP-binding protein [Pyrinomonadaceae bacterium]
MSTKDDEEQLLRSVVQQNAQSIHLARRRADEALRKESDWLRVTLSSIGDAVITTDVEGRVTFMNRVAESLTGWAQAEVMGRSLPDIFQILNEQSRQPVENPALQTLSAGTTVGLANHTILIAKDGTECPIDDSAAPIRNEQGEVVGTVLVFRDISERKRMELERERLLAAAQAAQKEAEQANRLKDEFLATASHELRTPLTAVVGWSRLLRTGKLDAENSARALEAIERNATLQTKLIDDLLDVSRIITGKLTLDRRPLEIAHVVSDAVNTVRPAADAKNIAIETSFDAEAEPVLGDANRLQQVVWNLLSNAVKFTPKNGRIEVALQRVNSEVQVSVGDSGEGISSEFLPYVFDRFSQGDGKSTRSHSGLGLGLAIVRQLVELHGGTVKAHSDGPGRGATFELRLPVLSINLVPGSKSALSDSTLTGASLTDGLSIECRPRLDGVRVLVVDDDFDTRQMLKAVLSECHADVITAASAAEAIKEIEQQKPDVLVSDLGMPEQDGYELIKQVRKTESADNAARVPALALTAYAKAEDRVRALAGGYQVHLAKPVEPAEFVLVVANLAGRGQSS